MFFFWKYFITTYFVMYVVFFNYKNSVYIEVRDNAILFSSKVHRKRYPNGVYKPARPKFADLQGAAQVERKNALKKSNNYRSGYCDNCWCGWPTSCPGPRKRAPTAGEATSAVLADLPLFELMCPYSRLRSMAITAYGMAAQTATITMTSRSGWGETATRTMAGARNRHCRDGGSSQ